MATKFANIKGVRFDDGPLGPSNGGVAIVTFDLAGTAYTGGTDTVQLGGGGTDGGASTSSTLAAILQNRRRDGKTVTIQGLAGNCTYAPGNQAAATNGPAIYAQSGATSGGNVTCNLLSALTGGSNVTTTTAAWERALQISVVFSAA